MMNACLRWSVLAVPVICALGCSDPAPLTASGSLSLDVTKPAVHVSETDCPVTGVEYLVAGSNKGTFDPPSTTSPGTRLSDGDGSTNISCSVRGNGPYTFSGIINSTTNSGQLVTVNLTDGMIGTDDTTGTATLHVSTSDLVDTLVSATGACSVTVLNGQIRHGSVWAKFSCPSVTSPPSKLCAIAESVFVFENCDGS